MCPTAGEGINKWVRPCNGTPHSDKKEETTDSYNNMDEYQKHFAE